MTAVFLQVQPIFSQRIAPLRTACGLRGIQAARIDFPPRVTRRLLVGCLRIAVKRLTKNLAYKRLRHSSRSDTPFDKGDCSGRENFAGGYGG